MATKANHGARIETVETDWIYYSKIFLGIAADD